MADWIARIEELIQNQLGDRRRHRAEAKLESTQVYLFGLLAIARHLLGFPAEAEAAAGECASFAERNDPIHEWLTSVLVARIRDAQCGYFRKRPTAPAMLQKKYELTKFAQYKIGWALHCSWLLDYWGCLNPIEQYRTSHVRKEETLAKGVPTLGSAHVLHAALATIWDQPADEIEVWIEANARGPLERLVAAELRRCAFPGRPRESLVLQEDDWSWLDDRTASSLWIVSAFFKAVAGSAMDESRSQMQQLAKGITHEGLRCVWRAAVDHYGRAPSPTTHLGDLTHVASGRNVDVTVRAGAVRLAASIAVKHSRWDVLEALRATFANVTDGMGMNSHFCVSLIGFFDGLLWGLLQLDDDGDQQDAPATPMQGGVGS